MKGGYIVMPEELAGIISGVVARLPEWVRNDLASKDSSARERAEETLAAMIVAAASTLPITHEPSPD